jgi:hypothetical protein
VLCTKKDRRDLHGFNFTRYLQQQQQQQGGFQIALCHRLQFPCYSCDTSYHVIVTHYARSSVGILFVYASGISLSS